MKKFIQKYHLAVLSGLLVGFSYIPFSAWLSIFCFAPLWYSWTKMDKLKDVFVSGFITQFILTIIGFHWVAHTTVEFGHMPWPVGILVLVLFAAHANIHIVIAGLIWSKIIKKNRTSTLSLIILSLISATLDIIWPEIFSWNLGYTWYWSDVPIFQLAEWIGFEGLSSLTWGFNAICVLALLHVQKRKIYAFTIVAGFIFFNLIGIFLKQKLHAPDKSIVISMVQANIGNFEKFVSERHADFRQPIVEKFFNMTRTEKAKSPQSQLIVWPETAFPVNMHNTNDPYYLQIQNLARELGTTILTGAYTELPSGEYFNSMYLISSDGQVSKPYHKSRLLAFGEYFPMSDYFPFLKKLIPAISDFGRGQGPGITLHNELRIGTQVCYEGLFDDFSAKLAQLRTHLIVNVTNDSWFGHTFESKQHLFMTLARSVEFRTPIVRVTNTGVSAVANVSGEVLIQSPEQTEWTGSLEVPYYSEPNPTIYAYLEPWLVPIQLVGLLVLIVINWKANNVRNSRLEKRT